MKLTILFFAVLRERVGTDEMLLEDLPDELTVGGLKAELVRRYPALVTLEHVRGVLNAAYVTDETPLVDGNSVALIPPVSGGAPETDEAYLAGVFEVLNTPLDPAACQRRVEHPSCGAALVFTGMTRDNNRGKDVVRLDYEAYEAMTGPEMARIFERCRQEFGDPENRDRERRLRMLCQHRIGTVGVGEPSVVIAVASPHRDAAFLACRFLIDELKKSLPVWKKEVYPGGEHWIGDRS